jgi:hypothetical protein
LTKLNEMKLRSLCIIGIILTSFMVIKNLAAALFPEIVNEIVPFEHGSTFRKTTEYISLALYFLIFTLYIFKKKYLYVGIILMAHIAASAVFYYQMSNIDYFLLDEGEIAKMIFNIKMMGVTSIVTGAFFVISSTRRLMWLRIFGYLTIVSAIGMLKPDILITYSGLYVILGALIPAPIAINYWLELKQLNADKNLEKLDNDVLDVVIE